ncbi:hypothetical protein J8L04_14240 [Bacteroides fragilis]|uniref:hypothetical protein n=1 Tax=Bacteroides TaxID=816 RepID=UPI001F9CD5CB|nr:hypothetical protein [Bacteroides fragilis]MCM0228288.1 hypothetical protein [Bacteroides fragilis]MCM0262571.1 hypothetical protein [Bacteroides fragilis]UYI63898.1 MAG: hypothetical protein OGM04_00325 [Bacteroides ovatus]HJH52590.1 hypothetical protein [Phocaeicola vulgatus]
MEKRVGINQRISISVIEMAMKAALDGCFTPEYAAALASGEFQGENRINKARSIIGKLTLRNPLFPYIEANRQEYMAATKYKGDRAIIFTALINAAYTFGYDSLTILGNFFHVQEEVSTPLLLNRMSSIYASNRSLPNGIYCIMPMFIEAGLLNRPQIGVYTKNDIEIVTPFARELYKKSFFVNNPMLNEDDYDYSEHPYFEFV